MSQTELGAFGDAEEQTTTPTTPKTADEIRAEYPAFAHDPFAPIEDDELDAPDPDGWTSLGIERQTAVDKKILSWHGEFSLSAIDWAEKVAVDIEYVEDGLEMENQAEYTVVVTPFDENGQSRGGFIQENLTLGPYAGLEVALMNAESFMKCVADPEQEPTYRPGNGY